MQEFRPSRFEILPLVVKNLMIINGLMYLGTMVAQKNGINLYHLLGLHFFTSQYFYPFQFITHMFMHGSMGHIFSNMFALWMFGSVLENVWGPKRFLLFYLVCGLGGALMHLGVTAYSYHEIQQSVAIYQSYPSYNEFLMLIHKYSYLINDSESGVQSMNNFLAHWTNNPNDPALISQSLGYVSTFASSLADIDTIGASGAVFGVLIAFGLLFPNTYLYLYFFVPVKAKYFVAFYALFELYSGFNDAQDGIAHFAHLGGALVGFILVKYWNKKRRFDLF